MEVKLIQTNSTSKYSDLVPDRKCLPGRSLQAVCTNQ